MYLLNKHMEYECKICYITKTNVVWLECMHTLCKSCCKKLVKKECPFCRMAIKPCILKPEKKINYTIVKQNNIQNIIENNLYLECKNRSYIRRYRKFNCKKYKRKQFSDKIQQKKKMDKKAAWNIKNYRNYSRRWGIKNSF